MDDTHTQGLVLKKSDFDSRLALLVLVVLWVLPTFAHGQQQPAAASSLVTRVEREAFLATAHFATDPPTDGRPSWRASLDDGTRKHDASVVTQDGSGPTRGNYKFNVAAYELDKLLGLNLVYLRQTAARLFNRNNRINFSKSRDRIGSN